MKKLLISLFAVSLTACSSMKLGSGIDPGTVEPLKEQRLSTDFKREGVRVFYTFGGDVEKIEAHGYAPVWRGEFRIAAEADAKDKMIKFLRGESVDTTKMTKVIAKSIERSQDHTVNKFRTVDGTINTDSRTVEKEIAEDSDEASANDVAEEDAGEENSKANTAVRKASLHNAHTITSTITVQSKGNLSAVYKDRSGVLDDGKTYTVVYVWTPKGQKAARSITNMMDRR